MRESAKTVVSDRLDKMKKSSDFWVTSAEWIDQRLTKTVIPGVW